MHTCLQVYVPHVVKTVLYTPSPLQDCSNIVTDVYKVTDCSYASDSLVTGSHVVSTVACLALFALIGVLLAWRG